MKKDFRPLKILGVLFSLFLIFQGARSLASDIDQNTAYNEVSLVVSASDHVSAWNSCAGVWRLSKNGGAFTTVTPDWMTNLGDGFCTYRWNSSHTDTKGRFAVHGVIPGADPIDYIHMVRLAIPTNPLLTNDPRLNGLMYSTLYTAPDNTTIALVYSHQLTYWGTLQSSRIDASISRTLGWGSYTSPDNAGIAAIKAQTDKFEWHSGRFVKSYPQSSMVALPISQGAVTSVTAQQGRPVEVIRGDTPSIPFDFGNDYTGWSVRFGAKALPANGIWSTSTPYAIAVKDCVWTDASKGQGYCPLTSTEISVAQRLYAEIEIRSGASVLTTIKFPLKIIEDVIR